MHVRHDLIEIVQRTRQGEFVAIHEHTGQEGHAGFLVRRLEEVEEGFEEARAIGHVVGRIVVARGNHVVPQLRAVAQPRLAGSVVDKGGPSAASLAAGVEPVKHALDVHHRVGRVPGGVNGLQHRFNLVSEGVWDLCCIVRADQVAFFGGDACAVDAPDRSQWNGVDSLPKEGIGILLVCSARRQNHRVNHHAVGGKPLIDDEVERFEVFVVQDFGGNHGVGGACIPRMALGQCV